MGQSELGQFGDEERPAAEAMAVADESGQTPTVDDHRFPATEETVDIAVVQVDYTVEGRGSEEYPVVHVLGRTSDNRLVHARVLEFEPYFYAPEGEATEARLREYDRVTGWEHVDGDGQPYESIRGERLVKIFGQTPRDVGKIRDDFEHYEADILFPNRFLIDKDITSGLRLPVRTVETDADRQTLRVHHEEVQPVDVDAEPRVNTFDIEVEDRSGFPEDGEEPVLCITSHDSYTDEYVLWVVDPGTDAEIPGSLPGYEPIDTALDTRVRAFDTEEAMLAAFVDYLTDTDCDVATGWNFTDFDAPYLLDRLEVLRERDSLAVDRARLAPDRLSRVDEVWRNNWQGPNVKGRVMFDLLYAYRRTKFTELESYRLEDVGQRELGTGKERYPGDIGDLWESDLERLLEYNLRDVELCVELDREQDIVAFWNEVRQFVGCKLEDATTPGDAVDMYVLHKLHDEYALPSKGQQAGEEYEGGAVFDPITGVRENVSVLDLRSLYPMCMVTINASPETKVDPESYDGETYRAPNGTRFQKEPDGAIREMVDELLAEREDKKTLRNEHDPDDQAYEQYDRQQAAVKVIMNCFTPDTEVLTPDGVRNIRNLAVGDVVYSLDPETMEMETKPVVETQAYPEYRGELVDIETSETAFRVTPNHRMLVHEDDTGRPEFVEAGRLNTTTQYELPHDWTFEHDDALGGELDPTTLGQSAGDILADGGAEAASRGGDTGSDTEEFLELLARYVDGAASGPGESAGRHSTDGAGGSLHRVCEDATAGGEIPEFVFRASADQKTTFLEALVGTDSRDDWEYTTDSESLRDDVLRLCAHLGTTATYRAVGDRWRLCHTSAAPSFEMGADGGRSSAEDGVYCVTVADNHTLLAGRNGAFQFVGQSLYGVLGWDRFRLYDREMGAAVTATGREVIEFTEQATNELDKSVIYGDTDSIMISMGEDTSAEAAIEQSFQIEDRINGSYDEFAREQLNAAEHRFEIEFEKLYRRFFQAGKKKRYAGHIVWKEGKEVDNIDITGFEYQRSDIAPITKEVQREVIERIVTGEDTESVKSYVRDIVSEFQAGNVDPEEVGIPGGIGKRLDNYETDTAQVRGAKYANMLLGTNFGRGSKPKRLYLDRVHSDFFERIEAEQDLDPAEDALYGAFKRDPDVICFEYADQVPEEFEIDWEKMLDKTLEGPIERILEALDISWEEVKSGQDQTGLGEYM